MIASSTMPPASTTCTTESGTSAIAPMWKIQEPHAIEHAQREHARREQLARRPERTAEVHRRGGAGATMLVEKAEIRRERAAEREGNAQDQSHSEEVCVSGFPVPVRRQCRIVT